ncbi:RHS repeat-associated core domain-containing protein [Streptomyces griseus]|uniref:RHS repeat-associated core domain-containing protein n=1 Tax=Streptomyces griseus TaxID=1911 RepID=UPI0033A56B7D
MNTAQGLAADRRLIGCDRRDLIQMMANRFAVDHQDPISPHHFAARYYDPNIGRFTTPDPSGQEQNPYLYAACDPVNKIDLTGLAFLDVLGPAGDLIQARQHLAEVIPRRCVAR